ncbi:MAG TPA: hypothetical protein VFG89_01775 [Coriobacteriia bacterium]|nr:hypothetical protein [Coriobacteriia bacterium]
MEGGVLSADRQSAIQTKLEQVADTEKVRVALMDMFFFEQDEGETHQYKRAYRSILEKHASPSSGEVD